MQRGISKHISHELSNALLEAVWVQWRSLGTFVDTNRLSKSVVDPEALMLMSLTLRHLEGRLWDLMDSWARNGSNLFSIQRIKNLIGGFPPHTRDRLEEFAFRAMDTGKDYRWKSLAGSEGGPSTRSRDLWKAYPAVWHSSALFLRLRLGFGIGIASDLLAFLISLNGDWSNTASISQAIDYSPYSIRRNAESMTVAGILESTKRKPVQYRVDVSSWIQLLAIDGKIPEWRYWNKLYSFSSALIMSVDDNKMADQSPYLLSTELRDLIEVHEDTFMLNKIDYPDPQGFPGEEYSPAFADFVPKLAAWIRENV